MTIASVCVIYHLLKKKIPYQAWGKFICIFVMFIFYFVLNIISNELLSDINEGLGILSTLGIDIVVFCCFWFLVTPLYGKYYAIPGIIITLGIIALMSWLYYSLEIYEPDKNEPNISEYLSRNIFILIIVPLIGVFLTYLFTLIVINPLFKLKEKKGLDKASYTM